MAEQIILFDIPSKAPNTAWSLNPWKTRLLLNYKGLDYKTEWVEYPLIESTLKPHVPPNVGSYKDYTIPALRLPSGAYIMDSHAIAEALEALHPSPGLDLANPLVARLEALTSAAAKALAPLVLPHVPAVLNQTSHDYFAADRARMFGMSLPEFEARLGGEASWTAAEPAIREVGELLAAQDGPFFLGREITYADLIWGAFLKFLLRIKPSVYDELLLRSGNAEVHASLLSGLGPWLARDDH